jgi:sugar phosphate isomerase/epimerase
MCYGFDGDAALRRSLETQGASRRGLLRTAVAGAAATATVGAAGGLAAPAAAGPGRHHDHDHDRWRHEVPHELISIQLYTLRDAMDTPANVDLVLRRLAQYGYERVERAGLYHFTAAQMKARLDELGIWASSSHEGISEDRTALHAKLDVANTFGQRYIVVPYLVSNKRTDWEKWAEQMNVEAAAARRRGLRYGYHNHAHEFTTKLEGGVTPWEVLTENLDPRLVHLEVDLYWVYTGAVERGESDPIRFVNEVIRRAPQKVRQYHVKDRDAVTGDMADLGTGVIDFTQVFTRHQVEEYIVENDTPDVTPLTSAAVGHLYLEHLRF